MIDVLTSRVRPKKARDDSGRRESDQEKLCLGVLCCLWALDYDDDY